MLPIIFLVIYLGGMIALGAMYSYRQKTAGEYLVASNTLGPNLIGISNLSLNVSAATFLGFGGMAYAMGMTAIWIYALQAIGIVVWARWGATRVRAKGKFDTLPAYLQSHYGGKWARRMASMLAMWREISWVASGLTGFGLLGGVLLDVPYWLGALFGLGVTVLYVTLGGYMAATITNFFQTLLIFGGSFFLLVAAIAKLGGPSAAIEAGIQQLPVMFTVTNTTIAVLAGWFLTNSFYYWTVQSVVIKTSLSAANPKIAMKGSGISGTCQSIWYMLPFLLGMTARAALGDSTVANHAYIDLIMWVCGPVVGAMMLVPFAAAIMATADHALLSAAGNIVEDWYSQGRKVDEKKKVLLSRVAVVGLAIFAYTVALVFPHILELCLMAVKFGAILAPAMIGSIFWEKSRGCIKTHIATMIIGATTLIGLIWHQLATVEMAGSIFLYKLDPIIPVLPLVFVIFFIGVHLESPGVRAREAAMAAAD